MEFKMNKRGLKLGGITEIVIIVVAIFAFAQIIGGSLGKNNLVSAFEESDLVAGVNTCLRDINGNVCQEFLASECNERCVGDCIPSRAENIETCKLGTCYDEFEGYCLENSPKKLCEDLGNKWFNDPKGNVRECRNGCCILAQGVYFGTEQECNRRGNLTGTGSEFRAQVTSEWNCLAFAGTRLEGACVFTNEDPEAKSSCEFTTRGNCEVIQGDFYQNTLCSNPELNTECQRQVGTSCFEGLDEVYWTDSCGNKENIYDVNKGRSWNEGKVLIKNQSCSLISETNLFANQEDCGNCNYLLGSVCGQPTTKDNKASIGDLVCKNLQCVEENGKIRENGESWCIYQGRIGVDENTATDTPGSSHYRAVCIDGRIETSLCGPGRTQVCTEERVEIDNNKEISTANCKLNQAQVCLNYNTGGKLERGEDKNKCDENPDCYAKRIVISESIIFDTCLPRYPLGFDLVDNPDSAKALCNLANINCVSVWVKEATMTGKIGEVKGSIYECVENCLCEESIFVENMHDYCMALGDCGASVNYIGDYSKNYRVSSTLGNLKNQKMNMLDWKGGFRNRQELVLNAFVGGGPGTGGISYDEEEVLMQGPDLSSSYINRIKEYYLLKEGEYIDSNKDLDYYSKFFSPTENSGQSDEELFEGSKAMDNLKGATGIAQTIAFSWASTALYGQAIPQVWSMFSGVASYASALMGAIIGFAAVSFFIDKFGLAPGLDKDMTYGLLATGALGGALVGLSITAVKTLMSPAFIVGIVLLIIVAVTIALLKYGDVGDVQRNVISFKCQPWKPVDGGEKCGDCGDDGLRCNKYACQSLGSNCRFINEGTDLEACINVFPNDKKAPVIRGDGESLTEGHYYSDETDRGVKILSDSGDGCVESGRILEFGINVDEPAECRWSYESKPFEDMELQFNHENLLFENHIGGLLIPSLEAFGLSSHDPDARATLNWVVRCKDSSGNANPIDYVISTCVKRGIDITAPFVTAKTPTIEYVKFGATEQEVSIWTNEPAECRWDEVDRKYGDMSNSMRCFNELELVEPSGWRCDTTLPILGSINTYSVRCKDQPSLAGINESARNANVQGYNLTLRKSPSRLNFEVVSPNIDETLEFPTEVITMEMILKTSGGMNDLADCYYIINDHEIEFFNTGGREHKQQFQLYGGGRHIFDLKCKDKAGNEIRGNAVANIFIDTRPPEITKFYSKQGFLNIITDEEAKCYYLTIPTYGINDCNYNVEDAEKMADDGEVHTIPFDKSRNYYIKCVDRFNNTPGGCSISLMGLEVPNV